ncbi:alpha/beta fold hydrolase [Sphingomonas sp. MAH-20]|uniref:Alpha/beta fold hydrolase n=1 Tax=Sphingomonas horti TaxID=2682842 RepID=A0A6I4IZV7_9SPHN|nr:MULTISPECIES: alpha/beta hydrolase [Sphingomonas]MBA2920660.1 alpha/beta hydrolase [Sphingomonas sp. CGMCC 1.13658]MVO77596.1 alpha/beta fold hydrolase [Sphingomonas horti]
MKCKALLALVSALSVAGGSGKAAEAATRTPTSYHWVRVGGLNLFYREAGPRDAPTIVLLHGYPSSSRMYEPVIPLLSGRYHLIAPDYPGFGHSDAPSPDDYAYTFDHLAESTSALLSTLGIQRYVLFMQDYGGPVGFRMMMREPGAVQAIIVQNANAYEEGLGAKWSGITRYWADPAGHAEELDKFMSLEGARQRHVGNSPNAERYNPDSWTDEYAMLSRAGARAIQGALLYDYRTNVAAYPVWQAWLRERQPPTLVLWGRYDPSFIVPGALAYAHDLPQAEIHLLDAGHFALDEKAQEVANLVLRFLDRRLSTTNR